MNIRKFIYWCVIKSSMRDTDEEIRRAMFRGDLLSLVICILRKSHLAALADMKISM